MRYFDTKINNTQRSLNQQFESHNKRLSRLAAETGSTIAAIANEAVRAYLLGEQQLTITNLDQRLRRVEAHLGLSGES